MQKPKQTMFIVTCDLDLWPFDPKINGFPGLMVEHFDDPRCIILSYIVRKTDKHAKAAENRTPASSSATMVHKHLPASKSWIGVGEYILTWQWRRWRPEQSSAVATVPSTSGRRWCRRWKRRRSRALECYRASGACRVAALLGCACLHQQQWPNTTVIITCNRPIKSILNIHTRVTAKETRWLYYIESNPWISIAILATLS